MVTQLHSYSYQFSGYQAVCNEKNYALGYMISWTVNNAHFPTNTSVEQVTPSSTSFSGRLRTYLGMENTKLPDSLPLSASNYPSQDVVGNHVIDLCEQQSFDQHIYAIRNSTKSLKIKSMTCNCNHQTILSRLKLKVNNIEKHMDREKFVNKVISFIGDNLTTSESCSLFTNVFFKLICTYFII